MKSSNTSTPAKAPRAHEGGVATREQGHPKNRPSGPKGSRCPTCWVYVKPENLPDHLRRVHAATDQADRIEREQAAEARRQGGSPKRPARLRVRRSTWAAIGVVAVLAVAGYAWVEFGMGRAPEYGPNTPVMEMCMQHGLEHHHYHAYLTITVLGSPQTIPANIGVEPGCMRPVHTHDATGRIHIETPVPHDFTLGDFFTVWNQPFSETQILSYTQDAGHTIVMTVNGAPSTGFRNLVFQDGQTIAIEYRAA